MHSGLLNLDKPVGMSSFQAVRKVRRLTGVDRAGHGGTLDPAASGVLPILLGQATRLAAFVHEWPKTYRAGVQLGFTSDTYDREGRITPSGDSGSVTDEAIRQLLPQFCGRILQVPPMHSALKMGGEALYRKARRGETVERPAREVVIHRLELLEHDPVAGRLELEVTCGKGMYVRSLVHDLGIRLGSGAYLAALRRTSFGPLRAEEAVKIEALESAESEWTSWLLPLDLPLREFPAVTLEPGRARAVRNGQAVMVPEAAAIGRHRLVDAKGRLVGLGLVERNGMVRPQAVFPG
jgi:tRNA pseudouridine55 synthase